MTNDKKEPLLEKGTILNGKWKIVEHIHTGGKGEVYRARQINLEREVAVKIISEDLLSSFDGDEEEIQATMERFRREVLTMAQVRHPNILQVYDQDQAVIQRGGESSTIDYLVMEYIPGPTLRSTLPSEGLRGNEKKIRKWIRELFLPVLDGVETIHKLGIIHRDLKPENILLDEFTPKIADFGLAGGPRWQGVTRSHHMEGTLPYMPSEQIMDLGGTDFRGDIYALGKILYEALIGKMGKDTAFPLKAAHLSNPDTPFLKRLDRIIQQATAEDKRKRISSVNVLRKALLDILEETEEPLLSSTRPRTKKARLAVVTVVLLVAASIGFHILYHRAKSSQPSKGAVLSSRSEVAQGSAPQKEKIISSRLNASFPSTLKGKDGMILHLVPQGKVTLPESFGSQAGTFEVPAFYMDETEVTNRQYMNFLNQVLHTIRVEDGVVKSNGNIWLLLGKITEGYDPIMFHNGRFFVTDSKYDYNPVVRITAYGAEAYARFYGRRLPNELEWFYANKGKIKQSDPPAVNTSDASGTMMNMDEMHSHMGDRIDKQVSPPSTTAPSLQQFPASVLDSKPNSYGIRGIDENVSEWGMGFQKSPLPERTGTQYVVLGGLRTDLTKEKKLIQGIPRHSWEAFEEVGFRCVLDVTNYQ